MIYFNYGYHQSNLNVSNYQDDNISKFDTFSVDSFWSEYRLRGQ